MKLFIFFSQYIWFFEFTTLAFLQIFCIFLLMFLATNLWCFSIELLASHKSLICGIVKKKSCKNRCTWRASEIIVGVIVVVFNTPVPQYVEVTKVQYPVHPWRMKYIVEIGTTRVMTLRVLESGCPLGWVDGSLGSQCSVLCPTRVAKVHGNFVSQFCTELKISPVHCTTQYSMTHEGSCLIICTISLFWFATTFFSDVLPSLGSIMLSKWLSDVF